VVRPTRVRRLRIRQAERLATLVAGVLLLATACTLAARGDASPGAESDSFGSGAWSQQAVTTDVGAWVVERSDDGSFGKATLPSEEANASSVAVGPSSPISVEVVVSGKVHDVHTNASTVGALLSAMGIQPDADDRVVPPLSAPLLPAATVTYEPVVVTQQTVAVTVPFPVQTLYTSRMTPGTVRVLRPGEPGLQTQTIEVTTVDGREVDRRVLSSSEVRAAVPQVRLSAPFAMGEGTLSQPGTGAVSETGVATWYDPPWTGLTAAHPWLPFGTQVTVTELDTGRSVTVVVDDRGPFSPGRVIDLSPEAFAQLSPLGRGVLHVSLSW
jgi:Lytic transglycolase/G5 domain/G5-linked-Ubiquitin-like domain